MDLFYIIVLSIAVVLFILILTVVGLMMTSASTSTAVFPPVVNTCPDYWSVGIDASSCAVPLDSTQKNVGSMFGEKDKLLLSSENTFGFKKNNNNIVFSDPGWAKSGTSALCAQQTWANKYNVMWDGVTNYNGC